MYPSKYLSREGTLPDFFRKVFLAIIRRNRKRFLARGPFKRLIPHPSKKWCRPAMEEWQSRIKFGISFLKQSRQDLVQVPSNPFSILLL